MLTFLEPNEIASAGFSFSQKRQLLAARYVHHSLPWKSCYCHWVIEWPGTKAALLQHKNCSAQANVWSRSSKKSGQTVPAWNHWQRPEERFPRIVADRLFHGTKNQAEKKLILEERIPSRRYSWRRGYPAYSSDGEFVSEFHSCPLALRSGHSSKKNRGISSCGSTNY